jgi:hypothetical protein
MIPRKLIVASFKESVNVLIFIFVSSLN